MKKITLNSSEDLTKEQAYYEAAEWYMQMQELAWDAEQQAKFEQWLELNPIHQEVWHNVIMFDEKLGRVPKGIVAKTMQQLKPKQRYATKFSLIVFVLGITLYIIQGIRQQDYLPELLSFQPVDVYKTQIGEQQHLTLADGSQVWLNSQSKIRVKYDAKQRRIELTQGEIYIETHKDDRKRPFSVNTTHGNLLALGTVFNVRDLPTKTELIVKQGSVRIQPQYAKNYQDIHAQNAVSFDHNTIFSEQYSDLPLLWRKQLLVVHSMPLAQFIHELSRYYPSMINLDPNLQKILISGAYPIQDVPRTLRMLQSTYHLKVIRNEQDQFEIRR